MEALIGKVISYRDWQLKVAFRGKWKRESASHSVMSDFSLTGSSVHEILQERRLKWAATSFSRDRPDPRIKPRSPALKEDALPSEPPGKP